MIDDTGSGVQSEEPGQTAEGEMQVGEVPIFECDSWQAFVEMVAHRRMTGRRIFRGLREPAWRLSSPYERLLANWKGEDPDLNLRKFFAENLSGPFDRHGKRHLEQFKEYAVGTPGFVSSELSDDDWLAIGRHHGLTSPLLDWTRSPFVAAYFAFMDLMRLHNTSFCPGGHYDNTLQIPRLGQVAIWEFCIGLEGDVEGISCDELRVVSTRVDSANRQKAQQGVFTLLTHDVHVDLESFLKHKEAARLLGKYLVPAKETAKALYYLNLMNINPATLSPDLDGAAAMANISYPLSELWRPFLESPETTSGESSSRPA